MSTLVGRRLWRALSGNTGPFVTGSSPRRALDLPLWLQLWLAQADQDR
jgi:hypothetical protein